MQAAALRGVMQAGVITIGDREQTAVVG